MQIRTAEEANRHPEYKDALVWLLYQLADDDFILAYRGSEWLGLAPHIEEDVAFSSISQNMMGHAAMYYQLLEQLGEGTADQLAHGRPAEERRNAILLELPNGPGHYLKDAAYDWAFTVVRQFSYDQAKKIRLASLVNSSYQPLAEAARKIAMEQHYHILHWKTWFTQLIASGGEATVRMQDAVHKVWDDFAGVLDYGPAGGSIESFNLLEPSEALKSRWMSEMNKIFSSAGQPFPGELKMIRGNGRAGEHSVHLEEALSTLREVYEIDPALSW